MLQLPPSLLFEVTSACNYHCPFCYCVWHERPELARPELDTKAWEEIIDTCASRGVRDITFTGGEATLRKDLWHLIDYARERLPKGHLALFTNGSRMTEERIVWCKDRKIRLATSLQGLRTYGQQTGTHRTYGRTLSFIARASELNWPVDVSITVTKVNLDEIADVVAAAIISNAATIQINAVMVEGCMRSHTELALSQDEWKTAKETIQKLPNGGIPRCFSDEMLCHCRLQPDEFQRRFGEANPAPCAAGKSFGVIGPSGLFRRCLHTVENSEWR